MHKFNVDTDIIVVLSDSQNQDYSKHLLKQMPSKEDMIISTLPSDRVSNTNSPNNDHNSDYHEFGYKGFIPLLEKIQKNLMVTNSKSRKSKLLVLEQLQNLLLYNIHDKITNLWKKDYKREARTYKDNEDDYHMESFSNEGPLITIAFLTFAVFLIKLVKHLIIALKNKQDNFIPPPNTSTPSSLIFGRRKREINEKFLNISHYLYELKEHNLTK